MVTEILSFSCSGDWSGGAKVKSKLPVPGRPTYLDFSRARAYCACSGCGWWLFGHFFSHLSLFFSFSLSLGGPGRVAQSVGHLTRKSGVLGSIPGLATYFRFSFRFFKKGSCQLLAEVCARSTG